MINSTGQRTQVDSQSFRRRLQNIKSVRGLTTELGSTQPSSDGKSRTGSMRGGCSSSSSLATGTVLRRAARFFLASRSSSSDLPPDDVDAVDEFMSAIFSELVSKGKIIKKARLEGQKIRTCRAFEQVSRSNHNKPKFSVNVRV